MSNELIGILSVGVGLAALIWKVFSKMDGKIDGIGKDLMNLAQRVSRLEGLIQGLSSNGGLVFRTNVEKKQEGEQ